MPSWHLEVCIAELQSNSQSSGRPALVFSVAESFRWVQERSIIIGFMSQIDSLWHHVKSEWQEWVTSILKMEELVKKCDQIHTVKGWALDSNMADLKFFLSSATWLLMQLLTLSSNNLKRWCGFFSVLVTYLLAEFWLIDSWCILICF